MNPRIYGEIRMLYAFSTSKLSKMGLTHQSVQLSRLQCPRNGTQIWLNGALYPLSSGRIVLVIDDISAQMQAETEKQQLARQLEQSQRMEALGRLAGGVAHDFNNMLTVILANGSMLAERLAGEQQLMVREIMSTAQLAARLTGQLLLFGRQRMMNPVPIDPASELKSAQNLLQRLVGRDVDLVLDVPLHFGDILIDPTQFVQVVMNLVVNARDAMPSGGRLTIVGRAVSACDLLSQEGVQCLTFCKGCMVLEVTDTGVGISPESIPHLFEPFYTTKPAGKGTGLGLSVVYAIVKQSGGKVRVSSTQLGKGTCFRVCVPFCAGDHTDMTTQLSAPGLDEGHNEAILLVEDDPATRRLFGIILSHNGYRVLTACDGMEGYQLLREHDGAIRLVVTDVEMPRLNGREMIDRIHSRYPGIPVLFLSGQFKDEDLRDVRTTPRVHFLSKPCATNEFLRKVRECIDSAE
jgi:two-component system cell cycle sensor histidine kinase/response regulator CckA